MNSELRIRPFRPADEETVISIWRVCNLLVASHNDPARDIARKLAGYEGHRGWINYLAVHPDFQRRGFAAAIMAHAERLLRDRRCLKINLQILETNTQVIDTNILGESGKAMSIKDSMVGATALRYGFSIATRNTQHFVHVGAPLVDPFA